MNNEDNPKKFGLPDKEDPYEKYINKYYIYRPLGTNDVQIGKIKEIDAKIGRIILNPYFGKDFNRKSGKNIYTLIDKDFDAFLDLKKIFFEQTTEDSIWYSCYLSNKEDINESKPKSFIKRLKLAYRILTNDI